MKHIFPQERETTAELLSQIVGRFLLLNVKIEGEHTSVCVNVPKKRAPRWRKKENNNSFEFQLGSPPFEITPATLVLSYQNVNTLANNFYVILEAILPKDVNKRKNVSIGNLPRDQNEMGLVLGKLENKSEDIRAICKALASSIDTPMYSIRNSLHHYESLMNGADLSDYARKVLVAFSSSQQIYGELPLLRGYGTDNPGRCRDCPNRRDGRLRFYMQQNPCNPLATCPPLDYVAYEIKPLNISGGLNWNCCGDPRTDSVDLLMSLDGYPVLTEVKMAGDTFVSAAVVQLLYYASIMAGSKQLERLAREIKGMKSEKPWLCVIAEQRGDAGFGEDLCQSISFLRHKETGEALGSFYRGAAIFVIEERTSSACAEAINFSFRAIKNGEHIVDWRT